MTPSEVVRLRRVEMLMCNVLRVLRVLPEILHFTEPQRSEKKVALSKIFAILALQRKKLVAPPIELNSPLSRIKRQYPTISSFSNELVDGLFRFDSREHLQDLRAAFRFPPRFECSSGLQEEIDDEEK